MDPLQIRLIKLKCILKNKKFISIFNSGNLLKINLENIYIPFGVEKYNDKLIVNLEFLDSSNIHNNYLSLLTNLEDKINKKDYESEVNIEAFIINKTFFSSIKQSKLGHLLRTHITDSTKIFILRKDSTKMELDKENLKGVTGNIEISLKGIWINDKTYGFYWNLNSIQITNLGNTR